MLEKQHFRQKYSSNSRESKEKYATNNKIKEYKGYLVQLQEYLDLSLPRREGWNGSRRPEGFPSGNVFGTTGHYAALDFVPLPFSGSEQVALPAFEFEFLPCFHHGLQLPFLYYITLYQQAEEKSLGMFSSNFSALRCRKAAVFILMLDISDGSREEISNKCDKIGSTETGMGWTST
ncbi:hypothetical protein C4D60_Mb11t09260 [Musa balbisiana]|uniref:Uncharacterized protein n=1 Tax=Musa balbisiana TaxID=52838 RepID=A0A4S8J2U8_MUSBA|nr:hypothetical protein C4D60_Mb11t09260 [Musa balbisiana]